MATTTIRAAAVYARGKKVAEVESADYTIDSGDEAHHGTEGLLGFSKGQITTKITTNVIIPVAGMTSTLEGALLNKETLTIGWVGGGKMHQIDMNPMTASYKSDSKSGSLKGTFEFHGGKPDVTG
jgi:hypothetical protein